MEKKEQHLIRPWYRSLIFWLGAPGFLFINWSWWDSFEYARVLHTPDRVDPGTAIVRYYSLHSRVGIMGVSHESIDYAKRKNTKLPNRGFSIQSSLLSEGGWENLRENNPNPFQSPINAFHKIDSDGRTSYCYVAHWFALLVYSGIWGGIYCWRLSRLRLAYFRDPLLTATEGKIDRNLNPNQKLPPVSN